MSRLAIALRDAEPEDAEQLVGLWKRCGSKIEQALSGEPEIALSEARAALAQMAAHPDERLVVGVAEDRIVAAMMMRRSQISPLHTQPVVHTSYLHVAPEARGHGCARALMESALTWAEEKGIQHVSSLTPHQSRDLNRFLTRLSLGTAGTVRVSTTTSLRKKLFPERTRRHGAHRLNEVLAARRSQRRQQDAEST